MDTINGLQMDGCFRIDSGEDLRDKVTDELVILQRVQLDQSILGSRGHQHGLQCESATYGGHGLLMPSVGVETEAGGEAVHLNLATICTS